MEQVLNIFKEEFKKELDLVNTEYHSFTFNTSHLPKVAVYTQDKDIRMHSKFEKMFETLANIKTNCLYWFSVSTIEEANILKEIISHKKNELWNHDKTICRILPANNENKNSSIIYVGVRKGSTAKKQKVTNISGRIVQHLGYYKEGRTQGLQLAYFTNELNIDITFHLYSLKDCPNEYLYILEKIFAKKLRPICGKH